MDVNEINRLAAAGSALLPDEEWRPIPGYEGTYAVSNLGRIFSHPRPTTKGGILRGSVDNYGYRRIGLVQNGKEATRRIHTLVALAFMGPTPDGMEILHCDGDKANARLDNLRFGTHAENMADMVRHGRSTKLGDKCRKGHEFTPENTGKGSQGRRVCLACKRDWERARSGRAA